MIVVFGTICLDRIRRVPDLPPKGGYVEVTSEILSLGGEAANTAASLTAWGADVWLGGNDLGSGPEVRALRQLLTEKQLTAHAVGVGPVGQPTPVCDIYVTRDGERTMFGLGFSAMEPDLVPSLLPLTPGAWFTAEPNMATVARSAARAAHEAGMNIYLMDFNRDDEEIPPGAYWQTSTDWVGTREQPMVNISWVERWVAQKRAFAILSDGMHGFVAGGPDDPVRAYPPFPSPPIIDSTGAGDMFRAGMLFGLNQGWPRWRCLLFASAAGTLKCRSFGAVREIPSVAEIERLIAAHPNIAQAYQRA